MRKFSYFLILLLIFWDVFLFVRSSDIRIFAILLIYIFFIKILKLKSNTAFIFSLILLFLAYIQFLFSNPVVFANPGPTPPTSEKTAVWVFLLMVVGIIQKWRE